MPILEPRQVVTLVKMVQERLEGPERRLGCESGTCQWHPEQGKVEVQVRREELHSRCLVVS